MKTKKNFLLTENNSYTRSSLIIDHRGKQFPCFHEGGSIISEKQSNCFFPKTFRNFFWNKKTVFSQKHFSFFFFTAEFSYFLRTTQNFFEKKKTIFFWKMFFPCFHGEGGQLLANFGYVLSIFFQDIFADIFAIVQFFLNLVF